MAKKYGIKQRYNSQLGVYYVPEGQTINETQTAYPPTPSLLATLQGIVSLIGNVDHSRGNGPNAAQMRGEKLNDIRAICEAAIARAEGR